MSSWRLGPSNYYYFFCFVLVFFFGGGGIKSRSSCRQETPFSGPKIFTNLVHWYLFGVLWSIQSYCCGKKISLSFKCLFVCLYIQIYTQIQTYCSIICLGLVLLIQWKKLNNIAVIFKDHIIHVIDMSLGIVDVVQHNL